MNVEHIRFRDVQPVNVPAVTIYIVFIVVYLNVISFMWAFNCLIVTVIIYCCTWVV